MTTGTKDTKLMAFLPNDQPPWGQLILLGFQHVLTMFPATVLCALLTGFHVSTVLSVAGLATIVALVLSKWGIGKFIPLFYGSSFSYLTAYLAITNAEYGVPASDESDQHDAGRYPGHRRAQHHCRIYHHAGGESSR